MRGPGTAMPGRFYFAVALLLLTGISLHAENRQNPKKPLISVEVDVVNVLVTVRNKKGKIVQDLTRSDFQISEDGRDQEIRYFSRQNDLPLTVGLIVDTSPSEANMLEMEKKASRVFLSHLLRPDTDKAFLIQFNNEIELLQDVTSSMDELESALNHMGGNSRRGMPGPGRNPGQGAGALSSVLADSVYLASDEILMSQQGRKALIILGDGDHMGDREEIAVKTAQQADTIIYTIRIYDKNFGANRGGRGGILNIPGIGGIGGPGGPGINGPMGGPMGGPGSRGGGPGGNEPGGPGSRSDGKKNLESLSEKTGGAYFEVGKKESLEQIFDKIEEELRNQYSLGYTPDENARDGYRKIKVKVLKKGMKIYCREGYYSNRRTEAVPDQR